jgi:hypothetical protein
MERELIARSTILEAADQEDQAPLYPTLPFSGAATTACYLLRAGFLHGLFFDREDEGYMFLQNFG